MGTLQIKQTSNRGHSKVWKIDSKQKRVTLGLSRKADLSSVDPNHSPFQAVIEFYDNKWVFIQFEKDCKEPCIEIKDNFEYKFEGSTLKFNLIEKNEFLAEQLNAVQTSGPLQKRIILVSRQGKILKTDITNVDTPFYYRIGNEKHLVPFKNTTEWDRHSIEDFGFQSKLIQVEDLKGFSKLSTDNMLDKESKRMLYATLLSMFIFVFIGLFSKKPEQVVSAPAPIAAQNIVVKQEKRPQRPKQSAPKAATPEKAVAVKNEKAPTPQAAAATSPNKAQALLKGAIGARISQLMGKVSATDARTANVIATSQGIKAGSGPSGRALSALGNVESSGRDWSGEAVGSANGKVNTAGIAGGRGAASLGSGLAAGKTGAGGVGLLEDESEVEGGLDREVIAQYIKSQLGHILNCYERQLSAYPDLHGKVSVKFIISGTGQVVTQNIVETEMKNLPTESCMLSKVAQWKFPEPKGGTKVVVTYPFMFKSTN